MSPGCAAVRVRPHFTCIRDRKAESLGFEEFAQRTFALDRAGRLNSKGQGNPLRVATARPHDAEFFLARVSIGLQRAVFRALDRLGRRLHAGG